MSATSLPNWQQGAVVVFNAPDLAAAAFWQFVQSYQALAGIPDCLYIQLINPDDDDLNQAVG